MNRSITLSLMALTVLIAGFGAPRAVLALEEARTLPTLLIKGEVISIDIKDANGTLIKVKDRYGFETPIYVTGQTKFFEGETEVLKDKLAEAQEVEVEYSFDINTAKRYAVSMKLPLSEEDETASTFVPTPEAPEPTSIAAKSNGESDPEGAALESTEAEAAE